MNHLGVFIIVHFLFCHVGAQDNSIMHVHKRDNLSLPITIGILTSIFSLILLVLAYLKFCNTTTPHHLTHHHNHHELLPLWSRSSGIDKKVIESLPFFKFSSLKGSKEGLECVVCLSKFEDSDVLRLLPKCRHAFHMNCIDQWLESHSSCPLCRYKFDVSDLMGLTYSNSLRYPQNHSNLLEDPIIELFVQREEDQQRSSRFKMGGSFQILDKSKKELGNNCVHKFKHKIILSDILYQSRWSDVNSSDLLLLNSEMLNAMSSKRFSPLNSKSGRFNHWFAEDEEIVNIQEDSDRNTLYESKVCKINRSNSFATSSFVFASNTEADQSSSSRLLNPADKRSMSEITSFSRLTEFSMRNRIKESLISGNNGKDEGMRSLWLSMAKRTVQWLAGQEGSSQGSNSKRHLPLWPNYTS